MEKRHHSVDPMLFGEPFDCELMIPCLERGCKIIVDNLQESVIPDLGLLLPRVQESLLLGRK